MANMHARNYAARLCALKRRIVVTENDHYLRYVNAVAICFPSMFTLWRVHHGESVGANAHMQNVCSR